jgi:hypothetical protein
MDVKWVHLICTNFQLHTHKICIRAAVALFCWRPANARTAFIEVHAVAYAWRLGVPVTVIEAWAKNYNFAHFLCLWISFVDTV